MVFSATALLLLDAAAAPQAPSPITQFAPLIFILLKVADNVKIEIDKAAVATVVARSTEESSESAS